MNVTVVRHWFGAHTQCDCGHTTPHRLFVSVATLDAFTHAYQTGHMPAEPLIVGSPS